MNAFMAVGLQVLAAGWRVPSLVMPWFAPIAVLMGIVGSWTGLAFRKVTGTAQRDLGWWGVVLSFWVPLFIWILVQFTPQD